MTLAALPKLLVDSQYRKEIVSNVTDPAIKSFFHFYESQNTRLREESIAPLLNKVSKFISNPLLRAVIGQTKSSFDFRWAMDNGKILLCNLSKGALGEDVSSLLGSLIVTKLSLASLSRQDIPESDRRPHFFHHGEPGAPMLVAVGRSKYPGTLNNFGGTSTAEYGDLYSLVFAGPNGPSIEKLNYHQAMGNPCKVIRP